MTRAFLVPLMLGACALLVDCHGGGGGGGAGGAAPVIVAAAFVGPGPAPAAGNNLLLFLSRDVTLASGKLLTDADVTLSTGDTLGTVLAAPTLLNSRTVSIPLGAGVSFTPGTSTVAFSATNDVVQDATGGTLATGGTPVTIATSDGVQPTIGSLTLSGVTSELNGTGPAGGTLQVPQFQFTIDLTWSDNTQVDTARTQISVDVTVGTSSGNQPPGTNLVPFLTAGTVNATGGSYTVPTTTTFPEGAVTFTAFVVDITGLASAAKTFSATVRNYSDNLRPFETTVNAAQVWFVEFTRDVESYSVNLGNANTPVVVTQGASGRSDFEEMLLILGLLAPSPIPNVSGSLSSNDVVLQRFRTELQSDLTALYSGCNVQFTYSQPPGSFGGNSSVAYNSLGYSQISIAGSADTAGTSGILGVAIFDPHNPTQNDNTQLNFSGQRLGIFLHTLINDGFKQGGASLFRMTFDPFTPARSGTPIGGDASDGQRLTGALTDARSTLIDTAITGLAKFTSVVTAHECGHSVGLVQDGAMPNGLYGGDTVNFPGSTSGHIKVGPPSFPAGSTNVMSPALNYSTTLNPNTGFDSLNLAYLRERVLYN